MKCARAGCPQTYEGDAWFCALHSRPKCGEANVTVPTIIRTSEALRDVTGLSRNGEWMSRLVEECPLSVRTQNCLHSAGVSTLGEVVESWRTVIRQYMFGRKCADELVRYLTSVGAEGNRADWQAMI